MTTSAPCHFRHSWVTLLAFTCFLVLTPSLVSAQPGEIELDHIDETTLHFKAIEGTPVPKPVKTDLYELRYLGVAKSPAHTPPLPPYFFFTGRPCKACQQDTGVYAIRPPHGRSIGFAHPGKIFHPKSRVLLLESRAFLGHCLARPNTPVYVVFQKERVDRKKQLQSSVLIAEPGSDHMTERLLERNLPRLQTTLKLVKAKACYEIEGRNRLMTTKSLNSSRRSADEPLESGHDEGTKENQTDGDLKPSDTHGG